MEDKQATNKPATNSSIAGTPTPMSGTSKQLDRTKLISETKQIANKPEKTAVKAPVGSAGETVKSPVQMALGDLGQQFSKFAKIALAVCGVIIGLYLIIGFLMLTGVDTIFIKINLDGQVTDQDGAPVAGAVITIDERQFTSDIQGKFNVPGLNAAEYGISIVAEDFKPYIENIALGRNFFDYNSEREFVIEYADRASLSGKLIALDDEEYKFVGDVLTIDGEPLEISSGGEFELPQTITGDYTLVFESPNYTDLSEEIEVKPGENELGNFELKPAGDIIGELKSYLTEELILDSELIVEGVSNDLLSVDENGKFRYRDLKPGETYKLRSEAAGFNIRTYEVTVEQGENDLETFRLVESGTALFIQSVEGVEHVFVSDYDGENSRRLTLDRSEPENVSLSRDGETVRFSGRGSIGRTELFATPINTAQPTPSTSNVINLVMQGFVGVNFHAERFLTIYEPQGENAQILEMRNINGAGPVVIEDPIDGLKDPRISDNGVFLTYVAEDPNTSQDKFVRLNVNTGESRVLNSDTVVTIHDISSDGTRILYTAFDEALNANNLRISNAETGETVTIDTAITGSYYQFVGETNTQIIYIDQINGRRNIVQKDLETQEEENITKFGGVISMVQHGGIVHYYKSTGLYGLDLRLPIENKLITSDAVTFRQ